MSMTRTYDELIKLETFKERFDYLRTRSTIGIETFGHDRWINQKFYKSREWINHANSIIVRDNGCDLALPDYKINDIAVVHHINPISVDDIINNRDIVWNPKYLITVSFITHNHIHYSSDISSEFIDLLNVRKAGDTKLW